MSAEPLEEVEPKKTRFRAGRPRIGYRKRKQKLYGFRKRHKRVRTDIPRIVELKRIRRQKKKDFERTRCPKCGGPSRRVEDPLYEELDTRVHYCVECEIHFEPGLYDFDYF